jgi:hypothetical protein
MMRLGAPGFPGQDRSRYFYGYSPLSHIPPGMMTS